MCRVETPPAQIAAAVALAVPVRPARAARRKQARRARRGMAALLLTMVLAAVLGAAALAWEIGLARDRIAGQAALLAEAVAAEGYALHHWMHNWQDNPPPGSTPPPPRGFARELTVAETDLLEDHAASAPFWRLARGWEVTRLMGLAQGAVAGTRIHGILVLRAPPGAPELLRQEVGLRLGAAPPPPPLAPLPPAPACGAAVCRAAGLLADTAPTFTLIDVRDIALPAFAFARIDPTVVLRSQRAGFAPPQMADNLDMGGNNLIGAGEIEVGTTRLPPLRPPAPALGTPAIPIELTGGLDISDDLTATGSPTTLATLDVGGRFVAADILNADHVRGNGVRITGRLTVRAALVACAARPDGTCNGGSLDFSAGTGLGARWSRLLVFGNVEIGRLGGGPPPLPHPDIRADAAVFTTLPRAGEPAPALSGVQSVRCGGGCPWLIR